MNPYRNNEIVHAFGVAPWDTLPAVCEGGPVPTLDEHWAGVNCLRCLERRAADSLADDYERSG